MTALSPTTGVASHLAVLLWIQRCLTSFSGDISARRRRCYAFHWLVVILPACGAGSQRTRAFRESFCPTPWTWKEHFTPWHGGNGWSTCPHATPRSLPGSHPSARVCEEPRNHRRTSPAKGPNTAPFPPETCMTRSNHPINSSESWYRRPYKVPHSGTAYCVVFD